MPIGKAKEISGFHYNTFYHLYHTLVAPVMDYSSCIWGYRCQSNIETIQNSALRFYLSAGKHHPIYVHYRGTWDGYLVRIGITTRY